MPTRRQFFWYTAGISAGSIALVAADARLTRHRYDKAARELWREPLARATGLTAVHHALIRAATLAPSSHNTQCWKFGLSPDAITILPDFTRRCPAVDPDDHHLYVSLGCAAENIAQAATAHGLRAIGAPVAPVAPVAPDAGYRLQLAADAGPASPLYAAITSRQSARNVYDGRPLTSAELAAVEQAGSSEGVLLLLLTERPAVNGVLDAVVSANATQMQDTAFVAELRQWIRFSRREALDHRDGLFGHRCLCRRRERSGALDGGGAQFAAHLGLGRQRPDLVVRFGRGPAMARSLRRPVSAVIV